MRAFIIGSKELSCVILETMLDYGYEVLGVFSRDREPGMNTWHDLGHRSLEILAREKGIPVYDSMKVNSHASLELLSSLNLDLIVSCFWSELFKEAILNIPKLGVFNIHTALLPANRGSRPGPWAIINGDEKAGVTFHKMTQGVDDGPIVDQIAFDISNNETAASLYQKVNDSAVELVKSTLRKFLDNSYTLTPQNSSKATYQLRGEPFGGQVNAFWSEIKTDRFKRAMTFPPFKAYRLSPHHSDKAELVLTFINEETYQTIDILDLSLFKDSLSGGNAWQRKFLKSLMTKDQRPMAYIKAISNFKEYQPLLESLKMRGYKSTIGKSINSIESDDLEFSQPNRETNGMLILPVLKLDEHWTRTFSNANNISIEKNCPIYLIIDEKDLETSTSKESLSQEILNLGGRLASIDEVCTEFDMEYENIST